MTACQPAEESGNKIAANEPDKPLVNDQSAAGFVSQAEAQLEKLGQQAELNAWVNSNFITSDTEQLSATANEAYTALQVSLATQSAAYNDAKDLDEDTRRKLGLIRSGIVIPAPTSAVKMAEQSEIGSKMSGLYGKGKYCYANGNCLNLGLLSDILAESRDPDALLEAWNGWRTVSPPMRDLYARQTELANEGARQLGFADLGSMWRSGYDMSADQFSAETDRLWAEVKPLYTALQCHVRARLGEQYGTKLVPQNGPIPAHLLGNMWAQDWSNIYPLVGPTEVGAQYDLSTILKERQFGAVEMVKTGEGFFSSLGFDKLPATFWQRSLLVKPQDREVICHASAWDIDGKDDLRIKMCINTNAEDFRTIHHELGHNYYQRAYNQLSFLYRDSANDGFHEAVGDTIALSITPEYLQDIGLLEAAPDNAGDIPFLMKRALEGIAFLPFSLVVDQWRWRVFAGEVAPEAYNDLWWQLREQYQGVKAPNERPANAFDPGAKYHVPGNTPYARYFLARILQFQFHRSLCEISGNEGPIHLCSIYGNQQAGERLNAMLKMGRSQPWPLELEALTGQSKMDATAILEYFAPLKVWLDEQNKDRQCGW